ncbi:MAG: hypothetical protein F4X98_05510, partial [Gammaproteobacteria bacterium]|nr:hypothetical protein [Gammaproteobacteria bacterium]
MTADALDIAWQSMDGLNADLPAGVRVFMGTEPNLPLRAWYVSVAFGEDSGRVEVLVSDDPEDRRETVSSFAADTGACVVINGGYFTMEQTPARHVGLLVVDGAQSVPTQPMGGGGELPETPPRAGRGFRKWGVGWGGGG